MPVTSGMTAPKGNVGMTLFGSSNDDSTVTLPDIGFNFSYNAVSIRQLYTSGNTWVGFGSGTEHLCINRRDASYNKLYYASEVEYSTKLFRIRFEGNSYYSSWNSNDLIWELSVFETGVIRLVIEKIPNNGSNSFNNPGVGTQSLTLAANKSYIFTPSDVTGKNFVIQEGSYLPCVSKYLIVDSDGVKNYQGTSWIKVGDLPLTEEMFKTYGNDVVPASLNGLVSNAPQLFYYTDNPDVKNNKNGFKLSIKETVTSKPKVIVQNYDFNIHEGKTINRVEAVAINTKKDTSLNDVATNGRVRIALSVDSGTTWLVYNLTSSSFEAVDISNADAFLLSGMLPAVPINMDYTALNNLLSATRKLRFSYIIDKPALTDVGKIKKMKIFYS